MKLMIVGEANKGKTSLLLSLTKTQKGTTTHFCPVEMGINDAPLSTVGVELAEFKYSPNISKPTITFLTWDFGGQVNFMVLKAGEDDASTTVTIIIIS